MPKTRENPYHCDNAIEGLLHVSMFIKLWRAFLKLKLKIISAMSPKTFLSAQSLLAECYFQLPEFQMVNLKPFTKWLTLHKTNKDR